MFHRFKFEAEFYPTLERIPFHVRMKLDTTGVKLSLNTWKAFSLEERRVICHLPAGTDEECSVFVAYLNWLSRAHEGEVENVPVVESSLWSEDEVPEAVRSRSDANGHSIALQEWAGLSEPERYSLYKTAISRDPTLFDDALEELCGRLRHAR